MKSWDLRYEPDGVNMAYTESGGPGRSDFVLVHGIGMGRVTFGGVAETLSGVGRSFALDLPGFGDSPQHASADSLVENAELVARFIEDRATGPVTLVGHSMGTQIVAELAMRRPELVSGLVLIAPTINRRERTALQQALRMVQDLWGEGARVLLLGMYEYLKTSPFWFVGRLRRMLRHRIELVLPLIPVPTLVLRGEDDRVAPRDWGREVASLLPNGELREIPGRGHEAIIQSAEPVASLILEFAGAVRTR
ncbi:alpha/beta fold hydrolase [Leucobacter luti]|uniref:alpha/beta fold hydrolase n=1 Tax=Leucobacter luti TaxID=340320 RepID=UPI001050F78E|nr:alpha/beta hydrolase [Leucobacter luti]MCW2288375.1 pimeloyl-ACP methyl ester carboxylesterase [Leucobacter luti]QYM75680.1 alpha/beta hydrolase [Leucobacter luti]